MTPGLEKAKGGLSSFSSSLSSIGGQLQSVGGAMATLAGPLAAGFGVAVGKATEFDKAIVNTASVLKLSTDETAALHEQLLAIGGSSVQGPQAVAEAYYDVAGGVADASTHMAILQAAMLTATAGNADLAGTTKAMISVMNSYGFAADQAGFASNVLTRTVGMGVGSMDEFAAALPQVTGLANSLGIGFDDLGAMTAYLTTQGNTASQATTQLGAMMTAVLKPNEAMKAGLQELGFASGEAAIEALGLTGVYQALAGTQSEAEHGMSAMAGTTEALRGITALAGEDFAAFFETFVGGVNSATDAAAEIQMDSAANQFAMLRSQLEETAIRIGDALLPALMGIVTQIQPVIDKVIEWVIANPELVSQIGLLAGAGTILGGGLVVLGTVLNAVGTIITTVTGLFGFLKTAITGLLTFAISPLGIALAAGALLVAAYMNNWLGFRTTVNTVVRPALEKLLATLRIINQELYAMQQALAVVQANPGMAVSPTNVPGMFGMMNQGGGFQPGQNAIQAIAAGAPGPQATSSGLEQLLKVLGLRDHGGAGYAGQPVAIGTGAQPEVFTPHTSGTFTPANQQGGMNIQTVVVYAADVNDFERQLQERRRRMG